MIALEHFGYGFRKTGQQEKNILVPRECSEPKNFVKFKGYALLKDQYAALEEFCKQYSMTPKQMFSKKGTLEVENGLVIMISSALNSISGTGRKLFIPKQLEYLQELDCSMNYLLEIVELPENLQKLDCGDNQLAVLPKLPQHLKELHCNNNYLCELPELPAQLQSLHCRNNQLPALPKLPVQLQNLYCSINHLRSLPELPAHLQKLFCGDNKLAALPELPAQLQQLYCHINQLAALPELPDQLQELSCYDNPVMLVIRKDLLFLREVDCLNTKISSKTIARLQKQGIKVIY